MDQNLLVSSGHALVKAMDATNLAPRFAMWVHNTDTNTWKLWLVPPAGVKDKHDFYRKISLLVAKHRADLGSIDASDTEMVLDSHPAMPGMRGFIKMPGLGTVQFSGNRFSGFNVPDGIILRSNL
jgi:hypothetical protein